MTHPHHLHALAATWSLGTAHRLLVDAADREQAQITAEQIEAAPGIQAWRPVIGRGRGGHSDPSAGAAILDRTERPNRWADLLTRTDTRIRWLADQTAPGTGAPLDRIRGGIPALMPATAAVLHRHLVDEDQLIRAWLSLGPQTRPLTGVECPACGIRQLVVQTAGPVDAWTVACTCRCTGVGCRCGRTDVAEGVVHIWPRDAVIAAVAGTAA